MFKKIFLILLILTISGCGTIKSIDMLESDMMPESVAISIFEKQGFKQWVEKPYLKADGFCVKEREYIEFSEIESAIYMPHPNYLKFELINRKKSVLCRKVAVVFMGRTEAQAVELTNAVRALGASKIDRLQWLY